MLRLHCMIVKCSRWTLDYILSTGIAKATPKAEMFIDETWELLLAGLEIEDDAFDSLEDILPLNEE